MKKAKKMTIMTSLVNKSEGGVRKNTHYHYCTNKISCISLGGILTLGGLREKLESMYNQRFEAGLGKTHVIIAFGTIRDCTPEHCAKFDSSSHAN